MQTTRPPVPFYQRLNPRPFRHRGAIINLMEVELDDDHQAGRTGTSTCRSRHVDFRGGELDRRTV
eukprot:scaffold2418_cov296-Prasinococcus_capsulatus_cf.AAC.2